MKFSRDQVFPRICKLTKGKNSSRMKKNQSNHVQSREMSFSKIAKGEGNQWSVQSQDGKRTCNCHMNCIEYGVCMHMYSWQCVDYLIYTNMCKHIHLVCRYKKITEEKTASKKANEPIKISDEEVKIEIELGTSTDGDCMEVEEKEKDENCHFRKTYYCSKK